MHGRYIFRRCVSNSNRELEFRWYFSGQIPFSTYTQRGSPSILFSVSEPTFYFGLNFIFEVYIIRAAGPPVQFSLHSCAQTSTIGLLHFKRLLLQLSRRRWKPERGFLVLAKKQIISGSTWRCSRRPLVSCDMMIYSLCDLFEEKHVLLCGGGLMIRRLSTLECVFYRQPDIFHNSSFSPTSQQFDDRLCRLWHRLNFVQFSTWTTFGTPTKVLKYQRSCRVLLRHLILEAFWFVLNWNQVQNLCRPFSPWTFRALNMCCI